MDTTPATLKKPEPTLQTKSSFSSEKHLSPQGQSSTDPEYDPCQNAKVCSPFYLYNHDSPRPSADLRQPSKQSIHVSVRDLEMGAITPSVTQEKINAQSPTRGRFRLWTNRQKCLTKPKEPRWLQKLPKKQRILVKLLIALLVIGVMIAVAVGIAAGLHSNVYGTDKTVGGNNS